MLALFLRVLAVFLFVRFVLRFFQSLLRPAAQKPATPVGPGGPARELVRDRVCNTFVPKERALRAMVAGREEHFCSTACRDEALGLGARAAS